MIIKKEVKVNITNRNISYYRKYNSDIKVGTNQFIDIEYLNKNSNTKIEVACDICGKLKSIPYVKYNSYIANDGKYYCEKCKWIKTKNTNKERYGFENAHKNEIVKEKTIKTLIIKYGVDNPMKVKEIKEKQKKSIIRDYDVENVFQNEKIKEKIKKKCIELYSEESYNKVEYIKDKKKESYLKKYGYKTPFSSIDIQNKIKNTNLQRYGVENISNNKEIKDHANNKARLNWFKKLKEYYSNLNIIDVNYETKELTILGNCNHKYNISFGLFYNRNREIYKTTLCTICNPINKHTSGKEVELINFISSNYQGKIIINEKILDPFEIDVYLPELKIGFEFNGLFWHSDLYKEKNYHMNKTEMAEKNDIKLIHIYEDDWLYKQDIIKSKLLNLLAKSHCINAYECEIREISDNNLIKNFLNQSDLQGFIESDVKVGLFYKEELISLMIFGSYRKSINEEFIKGSYELLRFCDKLNFNVVDGASRLFEYFVKSYNPIEIISYSDRSWQLNDLYEKMKFKLFYKTRPDCYHIINNKRFYKLDFSTKENHNNNEMEYQIIPEKDILKIYDSGSLIFKFNN